MAESLEATKSELLKLQRKLARLESKAEQDATLVQQLTLADSKNDSLVRALKDARDQIIALRKEIDKLAQPPSTYGIVVGVVEDNVVDILTGGRKLRVACAGTIDPTELTPGREVLLNEALNIVSLCGFERLGDVVIVKEVLEDGKRVLVTGHADEETVALLAGPLLDLKLRVGDYLMMEPKSSIVLELIPKSEVNDLLLEELPDIDYDQIGGLASQIEAIRDAVELPYLHKDLFLEHKLRPPKGVLLYGPPGCGKTLIAKAVASGLGKKLASEGKTDSAKAYFINVKGPELLNKYVGETERHIRLIFARAREKASEGNIAVIFFDEMESLFRTRGSGVSSDVETTIVPQLLAEMDGVEKLENVLVIGASNREDMIDPAILRPGRLDVKIKVARPDEQAAVDIFSKYLTDDLPLHPDDVRNHKGNLAAVVESMILNTVSRMYAENDDNRFLEVTYASGEKEILHFKDFNSGAMIQNIVDRAKKMAIKDFLKSGIKGLSISHLEMSIRDEFKENEDLPNTTNPDDWARISGKKGERIVYIRTLIADRKEPEGKEINRDVQVGQYL